MPETNHEKISRYPDKTPKSPQGGLESSAQRVGSGIKKVHRPAKRIRGQALINSEAKYRRLFEVAKDGILILDAKTGRILDVNPFLMKLLDYPRSYFLGRGLSEIGLFSDVEAFRNAFQELKDKRYIRYEDLPLKSKDGRAIRVEFVSNIYGKKTKQVIQCDIRDVSAGKDTEQSGQRLLQAQKMEAVGQLAAGAAHDFNSFLQVILSYSEILQQRADLPEQVRTMVAKIQDAGASAKNLTQRLLGFSHHQVIEPTFMDLNEAVIHIKTLFGGLMGADIELEFSLSLDLGAIKADPHQVEQVLMNLAINARDAMPNGGKIIFETENVEIEDIYTAQRVHIRAGRYVMLTVRDTGAGMDLETQAHAFEPFFSTKAADKGTGLGLAIVFSIVSQCGGGVSVFSLRDQGTTFTIHFPRCDGAPSAPRVQKACSSPGGVETILLVDDAPALRKLLRIILESRGYIVLDSGDPVEALQLARDHSGPLPLLITDLNLPGFGGHVLADRLAAYRPEMKVLYTSGGPDTDARGVLEPDYAFLEKPFSCDDLMAKVREILDSPKRLAA
jgi:two-component system, cell cycle sensor histidine kinase and response regulator CckA